MPTEASRARLLPVLLAVPLAAALVLSPRTAGIIMAAVVVAVALGVLVLARPERAFAAAPALVLLAWTKFRGRDPSATLSGAVDIQVAFELAVFAFLLLIAAQAWRVARAEGELDLRPVEWALLGYGAFAVVSTIWSPLRPVTAVRSVQLLILIALAVGIVRVRGPRRMLSDLVSGMILYAAVFSAITLVVPSTAALRQVGGGFIRYSWFAMHPGSIALLAGSALVLLTAEGVFSRGGFTRRHLGLPVWLCIAGMAVLLFASRGRGQAIATAAAILVIAAARYAFRWLVPVLGASVAVALLLVVNLGTQVSDVLASLALSDNPLATFVMRGQTAGEFLTLSNRTNLWDVVFRMVTEQPVMGHGYISSRLILMERVPWASYAHNAWFQSLLDLGVVGTVAIGGVLLSMFRPAVRSMKLQHRSDHLGGVAIGLGTFFLLDSVTSASFATGYGLEMFVFLAGVMAAASYVGTDRDTSVQQATGWRRG